MKKTIKELRNEKNLLQSQVAKFLGVPQPRYVLLEQGKARLTNDQANKLAEILGVSLSQILEIQDNLPKLGENIDKGNTIKVLEENKSILQGEREYHIFLMKLLRDKYEQLKKDFEFFIFEKIKLSDFFLQENTHIEVSNINQIVEGSYVYREIKNLAEKYEIFEYEEGKHSNITKRLLFYIENKITTYAEHFLLQYDDKLFFYDDYENENKQKKIFNDFFRGIFERWYKNEIIINFVEKIYNKVWRKLYPKSEDI